jgi:site-specific DNA-methyltransferase (adenine-specific)
VYLGSNDLAGATQTIYEILANSVDEANSGFGDKISITIHKDNSVTVSDYGRGVPMSMNKKEGKYAYEMMCYIGGVIPVQSNTLKKCSDIEKRNTFSIAGRRSIFSKVGGKADHFTRYGSTQWSLPTEETYKELTEKFNLREWHGFREYESLRQEYESLRQEYESLRFKHNLDENHNNVFKFKRDTGKNFHSCQKPIDILSRLMKCSSNEGDTVLDMFMGSGSTGVACVNTNRRFIGIEKDDKYFEIAKQRIDNAVFSLQENDCIKS